MTLSAVESLEKTRWYGKIRCTYCGGPKYQSIGTKKWNFYKCDHCKTEFSVITGTIFDRTKLQPHQLWALLSLFLENQLDRRPSNLCLEVGVHHWTMSKLITKIRNLTIYEILNTPLVTIFISMLETIEVDKSMMPYFEFMYVYKEMRLQDPLPLSVICGMDPDEVNRILERINKCWLPDKVFLEDEGFNWNNWEDWDKDITKTLHTLHLHAMCLSGDISRDPSTEMYYLDDEQKNR